jgi:hypothetical protein
VEVEDINFFIVGPHWYFRPHMGLLTLCAQHYEGLLWLGAYYACLLLLPLFGRMAQPATRRRARAPEAIIPRDTLLEKALFAAFICCLVYVGGTLPCARFFYDSEEGFCGNWWLRLSYQYLYAYLCVLTHWCEQLTR